MHLTGETKIFLGIIIASIILLAGGIFFFSRPTPSFSRDELLPKDTFIRGSASASAYLVEFSDFQCPACLAFKPAVDTIVKTYGDKLTFGYRHFPLPQHQFGQKAAEVAEAAGEQGKFWEMYEFLFANQNNFSEQLLTTASVSGLDRKKFEESLTAAKFKDKIQRDMNDGNRFGVNATPTFFLNGRKLELATFEDLKKEVEQVMK